MSSENWTGLAGELVGSNGLPTDDQMERYGFDPHYDITDLEAGLEEHGNVTTCPGCGWWVRTWDVDGDGYCTDC